MKIYMSRMAVIIALMTIIPGCTGGASSTGLTGIVQLADGLVRGLVQSDVEKYLGIPYAAPPTGSLRWKPPQDVTRWEAVRNVITFGNACPQPDTGIEYGSTNEDCLYLNIWTPVNKSTGQLPVMVWVHGGAFVAGSGSFSQYDGQNLAATGVVVVTINYRLGPLGFLAHSALSAESERGVSGNYGLLDQIAALQWVQENISKFGGNPNNVTIFGESAGAVSITTLMLSPLAEGLFHRVIAESGTPLLNRRYFPTVTGSMSDAEETGSAFAAALGCTDAGTVLTCMRAKSTDSLIETASFNIDGYYTDHFPFFPSVDGWLLPDNPKTLLDAGSIIDVPLIIGTNADEGNAFIASATSLSDYEAWVQLVFGDNAVTVLENFPATSDNWREVFNRLYTIALFAQPARYFARAMVAKTSGVYLYQFTRVPATAAAEQLGAYHGLDIPYVFGNLNMSEGYDSTDTTLSNNIISYWTNFATAGDPNSDDLAAWPVYSSANDLNLEFGSSISVESGLYNDACNLLDPMTE